MNRNAYHPEDSLLTTPKIGMTRENSSTREKNMTELFEHSVRKSDI